MGARAERAAETGRRIVDTAIRLLTAVPYDAVTLELGTEPAVEVRALLVERGRSRAVGGGRGRGLLFPAFVRLRPPSTSQ